MNTIIDNEINQKITVDETITATKQLRDKNSSGIDNIVNEQLKSKLTQELVQSDPH